MTDVTVSLGGRVGPHIEISILGYQFPDITDDLYDANWLWVRVDAYSPDGQWYFIDPFMLTWELRELIEWLQLVAKADGHMDDMIFLERVMTLDVKAQEGNTRLLSVEFSYEGIPPWLQNNEPETYGFDIVVSAMDLRVAASQLSHYADRFPPRSTELSP